MKAFVPLADRWARLPVWSRVVLALALLLVVVPWAAVQALPVPWAWIFCVWALAAIRHAFSPPRSAAWFSVGVVLLVLGGAELWFEFSRPEVSHFREGTNPGYVERDRELGYRPYADNQRTITRYFQDRPIYTATYTVGADGIRLGPPGPFQHDAQSIVFFGCSLTYGEGVQDDEPYPYVVGATSNGRLRTFNLAFSGYGPHQALRMLQIGLAEERVEGTPSHAFFLAATGHAARVTGQASWDKRGPRYRMEPDGTVRLDGRFDSDEGSISRRLRKWGGKSNIWKRIRPRAGVTPADIDLLAAVVAAVGDQVEARWPGCRFHVLVWDRPGDHLETLLTALEAHRLDVHRASAALPGLREDDSPFALHASDRHPNPEAHARLAAWISETFLDSR